MHRIKLPVCSQCRCLVLGSRAETSRAVSAAPGARRFRSTQAPVKARPSRPPPFKPPSPSDSSSHSPRLWVSSSQFNTRNPSVQKPVNTPTYADSEGDSHTRFNKITPSTLEPFFKSYVNRWVKLPRLQTRLEGFGIPTNDIPLLLSAYKSAIQSGQLSSTPELQERYQLSRFFGVDHPTIYAQLDIIYSNIFFQWASDPAHEAYLVEIVEVPRSTVDVIQRLAQAAERMYPEEDYPNARRMKRKIIMHVGPTNSGKTHHALRALAASKKGVYAGPLRLLAHEIWERLNLGQIVPLGVEQQEIIGQRRVGGGSNEVALPVQAEQASKKEAEEGAEPLDIPGVSTAAKRRGNPEYAKRCNMLTGEEQKIVDENSPLLSCTVEMLSLSQRYEVAVVDEIQMIADEHRGGAWTAAVLGLCAEELHLCGEETAVPIVEALLADTGDELIVNRYNRLTPLVVEEEGLGGDLSKVMPGDCIVTFSRSSIFGIKRMVEEQTGMRCAVVYGRLPPEIRSEQAALFNDPDSGYDVMIGSDAIGMGLNLKIRRVIFEAVTKWDGGMDRHLSTSQIKQIAGRAGRFGLHSSASSAGYTTTLQTPDLQFIRSALAAPIPPLPHARLNYTMHTIQKIINALPPGSSMLTIHQAHVYASRMKGIYQYTEPSQLDNLCKFIDQRLGDQVAKQGDSTDLPIKDRIVLMNAPISWREELCVEVVTKFIKMFQENVYVDLTEALMGTGLMEALETAEYKVKQEALFDSNTRGGQAGKGNGKMTMRPPTMNLLVSLEDFHKVVVLYVWMGFRNPVAYSDFEYAGRLKERVERALEWCLSRMHSTSTSTSTSSTSTSLLEFLKPAGAGSPILGGKKGFFERMKNRDRESMKQNAFASRGPSRTSGSSTAFSGFNRKSERSHGIEYSSKREMMMRQKEREREREELGVWHRYSSSTVKTMKEKAVAEAAEVLASYREKRQGRGGESSA